METNKVDKEYWNNQYVAKTTGWDIGHPSPPLKEYIDQLTDKSLSILIPGCGNAYEAEYLLSEGFRHITVIDIAPELTATLQKRFSEESGKRIHIITGDFFKLEGKFDLILEQTFLSALPPPLREPYAAKLHELTAPDGKVAGVVFGKIFEEEGPRFGATEEEYRQLFSKYFHIRKIELCYNSIERRKGNELFLNLERK